LIYTFDQDYEIVWSPPQDTKQIVTNVRGTTEKVISERKKARVSQNKPTSNPPFYYQSLPEKNLGIIKMNRFRSSNNSFEELLEETFTQIESDKIQNLIIDLRNSAGGNSRFSDMLLSYITEKPFSSTSKIEWKISEQMWKNYKDMLPSYVPLGLFYLHPKGRTLLKAQIGEVVVFSEKPNKPKRNALRYHGDIYVLIGSRVFSTATMFAVTIKDYKLGTLIGEETGGLANSYGDKTTFDLPNTHLICRVSHKYFVRPSGKTDKRGVLPDYEVSQTVSDIASEQDTVMQYTKELIRSNPDQARAH
jgi:C-terminal processing protease CtpA/Prc